MTRDAIRSSMDVDDEEEKAKLLKGECPVLLWAE